MNWGTGIAIGYTSFALFMGYMVYLTTTVDPQLMTEDYYAREIAFQGKIDERSNAINDGQTVKFNQTANGLELNFNGKVEKLDVEFIRPSDKRLDHNYNQELESGFQSFLIPDVDIVTGLYSMAVSWESEGEKYYHRQSIYLN